MAQDTGCTYNETADQPTRPLVSTWREGEERERRGRERGERVGERERGRERHTHKWGSPRVKHPPARQLSQRERNNTTPTLTPSRISGLNPRPSTRKHTIMSRKAEGFSGNERCALNAGLQVNLIVSAIEPLHRLLMFLRQFGTRIGEELLKAKHLSESAKRIFTVD